MNDRQGLMKAARLAQIDYEQRTTNESSRHARDEAFWDASAAGISVSALGAYLLLDNTEVEQAIAAHVQRSKDKLGTEADQAAEVERLLAAAEDAQRLFTAQRGGSAARTREFPRQQAFWEALQHPAITVEDLSARVGLSVSTVSQQADFYARALRSFERDTGRRVESALWANFALGSTVTLRLADGTMLPMTIAARTEDGIETEQGISILYGNPYAIDIDASLVYIGKNGYARFEVGGPWRDKEGTEVVELEDYARHQNLTPRVAARFDKQERKGR